MKTTKQQTQKINSDTEKIKAIGKEIKNILTWDMFIKDDLNHATKINDEMNIAEWSGEVTEIKNIYN